MRTPRVTRTKENALVSVEVVRSTDAKDVRLHAGGSAAFRHLTSQQARALASDLLEAADEADAE